MDHTIPPALRARLEEDGFGRLLGARLVAVSPGRAVMELDLGDRHMGTPGVTHGGCVVALAEAALAAATHAYNLIHLAVSVNVIFHSATRKGDRLTAEVIERRAGGRTAAYAIEVRDGRGDLIASLQAVVYRTGTPLVQGLPLPDGAK